MNLVVPSIIYKNSFLEALVEYHKVDSIYRRDIYELNVKMLQHDFPKYIAKLQSESKGMNMPKGYVPQTTYWLIVKDKFVGRVSIRHFLTEHLRLEGGHIGYDIRPSKRKMGFGKKMLSLALPKARELGLDKVLVTCDESNFGSKKIIEANGGVFENRLELGEGKPAKLRYWIKL